jgi:hypothetical protein
MTGSVTIQSKKGKSRIGPKSVIIGFFECATSKLGKYGRFGELQLSLTDGTFLLDELRNELLQLQKEALEEVVAEYNETIKSNEAETPLTTDDVQVELENLGKTNFVTSRKSAVEDDEEKKIILAIKRMNEAERLALARGVLATQWTYLDDFDDDDDGVDGMVADAPDDSEVNAVRLEGQDIMDYFNLCVTISGMEEFSEYLKMGTPLAMVPKSQSHHPSSDGNVDKHNLEKLAPEKRLILVQQVVLRAVLGYPVLNPSNIVVLETNRLLSQGGPNNEGDNREKKLRGAFGAYTSAMRVAYCNCWENNAFSN